MRREGSRDARRGARSNSIPKSELTKACCECWATVDLRHCHQLYWNGQALIYSLWSNITHRLLQEGSHCGSGKLPATEVHWEGSKMMASHSQQWKKSTESPAEGYDSYEPLKINFIYNVYVEVLIISPQDVSWTYIDYDILRARKTPISWAVALILEVTFLKSCYLWSEMPP